MNASASIPLTVDRAKPNVAAIVYTALPYFFLTVFSIIVFKVTVDDPFITFRYAANILRGYGPVFNPGEHVEGYTSPLHLLLSTFLLLIFPSIGILFKAKIASFLFACAVIWQTGLLAKRFELTSSQAVVVQLLLSVNMSFILNGTNGLETSMYACFLIAGLLTFMTELKSDKGITSALILFIALLARPEAVLIIVMLFAIAVYGVAKEGKSKTRLIYWVLTLLVLAGGMETVRHIEYGQNLPNTYFAKHGRMAFADGFRYLINPFTVVGVGQQTNHIERAFRRVVGAVYWLIVIIGAVSIRRKPGAIFLFVPIVATSAFILIVDGDWMPGWRFGEVMLPFLSVLEYFGLLAISQIFAKNLKSQPKGLLSGLAAAMFVVTLLQSADSSSYSVSDLQINGPLRSTQNDAFFNSNDDYMRGLAGISDMIKHTFPKGSVVAYSEMGYVSYENLDVRFIDLRGLTDGSISEFPKQYKTRYGVLILNWPLTQNPLREYILSRNPDAILTFDCNKVAPPQTLGQYKLSRVINVLPPTAVYLPERG